MPFELCLEIPELSDPFKVTLPGAVTIEHINLMEVIQPALTPLAPIFSIVDSIVAVLNCMKAVSTLDPVAIAECLPDLAEKVNKLLALHPMLSLPLMLKQLLDLVIDTLYKAKTELLHLQNQMAQIAGVVDRATELADVGLMAIAQCAQSNVAQEAANVGKNLASLGKLIGLINVFMSMVGGPEIPDLSSLSGKPLDDVIEPLDALVDTLKAARKAIPVP